MKVKFTDNFFFLLNQQIEFIATDKLVAVRKFKKNLISSLKKDLTAPYRFKKSTYFRDEYIRGYIFKGYTIVYAINEKENIVIIFEFIKYMDSL
jgi:mRNA-degrading endonuclease RelE of RelBE toxin-antitoxin system